LPNLGKKIRAQRRDPRPKKINRHFRQEKKSPPGPKKIPKVHPPGRHLKGQQAKGIPNRPEKKQGGIQQKKPKKKRGAEIGVQKKH